MPITDMTRVVRRPGSLPRALRLVLAPALRFESRVGFILESAAQGEAIRALRTGGG